MRSLFLMMIWILCVHSSPLAQTGHPFQPDMTNPKYEEGDWISTSMTRWVRNMAIGMEYVYFATTGGVSRYNYYTNRWDYSWTTSNGLADNNILLVAYDDNTHYVWCATERGVSCYFTTFKRWENYYRPDIGMMEDDQIISIGFDDENVWLETNNGRYIKGSKYGRLFQNASGHTVNDMNDVAWFGYRAQNRNRLPFFTMGDGYFFDADGFISDINLNRYRVTSWLLDKWGTHWVTTSGLGVGSARVRIEHLELLTQGLFVDFVSDFEIDHRNNVIWLGTLHEVEGESGISRWNIDDEQWDYFRAQYISELRDDRVNSIAIDDDHVYFGTEYGLAIYTPQRDEWQHVDRFDNLADNYIYDVEIDSAYVWVGTGYGLNRITKSTLDVDSIEVVNVMPQALRQVEIYDVAIMDNLIWLGSEFGVYIYDSYNDEGGFQAETGGPLNEPVYAVAVHDNQVWTGSNRSIEVFDYDQQKWLGGPERRLTDGILVNYIEAGNQNVWVATDFGVLKFDKDRKIWVHYTMDDGLIDNYVTSVQIDGDYVWFGTISGLTKFYWNNPIRID
ncbi:hypothetical protein JXB12_09610 [candidate division KSB1 bacterium]|nr:hypothetical protein [candidate division KSB1 bacterium]